VPVAIHAQLIGVGWQAPCVVRHIRTAYLVVHTEQVLSPGDVIRVTFEDSDRTPIDLLGAVDLEPGREGVRIYLIEDCASYRDFRENLTLVER